MKQLGKELGQKDDFVSLWGKPSSAWVHPEGIINTLGFSCAHELYRQRPCYP